ncbi:MAG: asparagine synthase (glutamine-hydrolyzing) [Ignavibacteria bacterium GWB2_35_12]|nr:MAG: asparagine synthase (glutamine-hydrolyzing) [Ignavibacteria bacterium GWA2_35_8]OGU37921.1 MAG: asparagine synthase (glutamine-hydrolyzing) [Ignavibacteria bacterium GWB2_35_12]OGU93810.1 MAG: asparagine synthase (glutamine-hydrolyzing) [Ignavibacteria bacterium RIFOXYA2_FULL_35_10]OGV20600.1 MAG: asparagine synthase (glutamine-hydrolyzing) [Ignavibacteria bacterium RIFOXYC2_FULL_35_21]
MCGIAGIFEYNVSDSRINEKILKSMSDVITHRGPDSEGQWVSDDRKCGFSFRRLAIIDLSEAANQPMHTPDGKYSIVYNGEVYNHLSIRENLEKSGYKYKSRSDTETILYGYREYGKNILGKLLGMWGMAIWDSEKKELFIARDRIGIKPLYYTISNGRFIFASEIKSILQHPSIKSELNLEELPNYLNYGMTGSESLFKNIKKLPPAHCLTVNSNGEIRIERYWSPFNSDLISSDMSFDEIQSEVLRLLKQSIKDRMMSDVPFGVFLSGGIDSSLNVALMAELMNRPVDTFTVGFKELEKYNELDYARKIANIYKTNHHEILIDSNDVFPILEDLVWHEDEPNADPVCMPLYFLSKLTRDSGTIVIQVGEGSDEQFIGYKWMLRDYIFHKTYWKYFTHLPSFIRKSIYYATKPIFKGLNQYLALEYLRRGTFNEELYWSGVPIYTPSHQNSLLNKDYHSLIGNPWNYASKHYEQADILNSNSSYLQKMTFLELQHRLPELLLMRVDKIGMAHSIEARVPFLDHRIVEFVLSIQDNLKVPDKKSSKYILKKAVESILPYEIINRQKQGFWAPVNEWLRNEWKSYAYSEIFDSPLMKTGIFNKEYINKIFRLHESGRQNLGLELYSLLMLNLWYKKFIA